ncbi:hypothetical protein FSP39_005670 [Pinctada imbricata]|uniref:Uncharacterized protein n=1 Tax=Pinctada imbricata TaxID=66713 RepID=A0AA88XQA9_PINIB|nr:hypothetical protein FSP39_005670 [Pinctada imbricata]
MASGSNEPLTKSKYFSGKKNISGARPSTRSSQSEHAGNTSSSHETSGNISLGEGDSNATLRRLESRLEKIEVAVDSVVKTEDLKKIISSMITDIMKQQREEFELKLEKSEERQKKEISKLRGEIDDMRVETENLKELIAEKRCELQETKRMAVSAVQKADEARKWANYNEQYSRKNNVKIFGLRESQDEDIEKEVIQFLQKEGDTTVRSEEIVAIHRIPGRENQARPILLKLKNSAVKGRVIRQRSEIKKKKLGVRLADDVTFENTKLMERLSAHEMIESTWFFNGSVYGKVCGTGRKVRFDINDEVEEKIRRSKNYRK